MFFLVVVTKVMVKILVQNLVIVAYIKMKMMIYLQYRSLQHYVRPLGDVLL